MGVTYGSLSNVILSGANDLLGARQSRPPYSLTATAAHLVADSEESLDYRELVSDFESHRKACNKSKETALNVTLKQMFSDIVLTISEKSQLKIFKQDTEEEPEKRLEVQEDVEQLTMLITKTS
jgi:hypothetical protein